MYYLRSTVSSQHFADEVASNVAAVQLQKLAARTDAIGKGTRALLHFWRKAHRKALQNLNGRLYVETCPAYLTTVDGCTRWSARTAWSACARTIGWKEVRPTKAKLLGARLRALPAKARRGGRHLLLKIWQARALDIASGWDKRPPTYKVDMSEKIQRLTQQHSKTIAIKCPAHHDTKPSLVLWHNGGALCMSCGWRGAWKACGEHIRLFESGPKQGDCRALTIPATTKYPPSRGEQAQGPVGGLVASVVRCTQYIGATLRAYPVRASRGAEWATARSPGHRLRGLSPLSPLQVAETRSQGPHASEVASVAALCTSADVPSRYLLADPLISVSCMGRRSRHDDWTPIAQRWMLFDLDDIKGLDQCDQSLLGPAIAKEALEDKEVGNNVAVVRTSKTGLQVWVELDKPRHSPRKWCSHPDVRQWHQSLGERLLGIVHRLGASEGHPDTSACGAGRFGRRPGWRISEGGELYRSRLLYSTDK